MKPFYRVVINFMDRYTVLCFTANIAVKAGKSVHDLSAVDGSYQLR
jgi:hypothetical protein